ncbi:hypothetical protein INR49_026876 [Caranx melampygus]|nr:hypothetical protein INR49_026876 [Caranx melampygus]
MATGKHRAESQIQIKIDCDLDGIVIPFFSLLIKDIYFLNEGCANRLQNGHVNFEKFWELAKQVSEFMTWKKVECPFEKDRKILQYLLTAPVFTEDVRVVFGPHQSLVSLVLALISVLSQRHRKASSVQLKPTNQLQSLLSTRR